MDIKERRTKLGMGRKDLAMKANIDPSVLQLLELGLSDDTESRDKVLTWLASEEARLGVRPSGPSADGASSNGASSNGKAH